MPVPGCRLQVSGYWLQVIPCFEGYPIREDRQPVTCNQKPVTIINPSHHYIIIGRRNQFLLSFLKLRVIVNDRDIYPLLTDKPVLIEVNENTAKVVVTDGFHFIKPIELNFKEPSFYRFKVVCAIDDLQLLGGFLLLALFYLLGFFTGIFIIKLISFLPIFYFLFFYYINRKKFIRVARA